MKSLLPTKKHLWDWVMRIILTISGKKRLLHGFIYTRRLQQFVIIEVNLVPWGHNWWEYQLNKKLRKWKRTKHLPRNSQIQDFHHNISSASLSASLEPLAPFQNTCRQPLYSCMLTKFRHIITYKGNGNENFWLKNYSYLSKYRWTSTPYLLANVFTSSLNFLSNSCSQTKKQFHLFVNT